MSNLETTFSISAALQTETEGLITLIVGVSGQPVEKLTRVGKPYLDIPIVDRSGKTLLRVWDRVDVAKAFLVPGGIYFINVSKGVFNNQPQLTLIYGDNEVILKPGGALDTIEDEDMLEYVSNNVARVYDFDRTNIDIFFDTIKRLSNHATSMEILKEVFYIELEEFIDFYEDMNRKNELRGTFWENMDSVGSEYRSCDYNVLRAYLYCPAASSHHGASIHGLIAHICGQLATIRFLEQYYSGKYILGSASPTITSSSKNIDWNVLYMAAILHDFYKTEEYEYDINGVVIEYKKNRPLGHDILMASKLIEIKNTGEVNDEFIDKLTKVILTHHGKWANYQPSQYEMLYPEQEIYHIIDLLEARITTQLEK